MRVYLDNDSYFDAIESYIYEKPQAVLISSYGIYAGISHNGEDLNKRGISYETRVSKILHSLLDVPKVHMLIGLSPFKSCRGFTTCLQCQYNYYKSLLRLLNHKELFPKYNWRVSENSHTKLVLFVYDDDGHKSYKGIGGGRNLTDSNWDDISFDLDFEASSKCIKHFLLKYGKAPALTSKYLNKLTLKYDISSEVIETFITEAS